MITNTIIKRISQAVALRDDLDNMLACEFQRTGSMTSPQYIVIAAAMDQAQNVSDELLEAL